MHARARSPSLPLHNTGHKALDAVEGLLFLEPALRSVRVPSLPLARIEEVIKSQLALRWGGSSWGISEL